MESTSQRPPVWPDLLDRLNKVNIFALMVGGTIVGGMAGGFEWGIAGFIGGGLAAVTTCGTLHLLLDIRRILLEIKEKSRTP